MYESEEELQGHNAVITAALTPEEEQAILDWLEQNPMPEQDENGIDLGHLRENLKLTPIERMMRHKLIRQKRKIISSARIIRPI